MTADTIVEATVYTTTEELTKEDYDEEELGTEIMHAFYLIGIVFQKMY